MKVRELNELYYIDKIIKRYEEKIKILCAELKKIENGEISTVQHYFTAENITACILLEIEDLKRKITIEKARYLFTKHRLEKIINSFGNPQINLILSYRFIDFMSWRDIAQKLGGGNTEDSVRIYINRFLRKTNKPQMNKKP